MVIWARLVVLATSGSILCQCQDAGAVQLVLGAVLMLLASLLDDWRARW